MSDGQLCYGGSEIKSESDCKAAASNLGLVWGGGWVGPGDFPNCLFANDKRQKVYYNKSPNPARYANNQQYAAICQRPSKDPLFYYIIKREVNF